jgi:hypothetical protein
MSDVVIGVRFKEDGSAVFEKIGKGAENAAGKARNEWQGLGGQLTKLSPAVGQLASAFTTSFGAVGLAAMSVSKLWQSVKMVVGDALDDTLHKQQKIVAAAQAAAQIAEQGWKSVNKSGASTLEQQGDLLRSFIAGGGDLNQAKALSGETGIGAADMLKALVAGQRQGLSGDDLSNAIRAAALAARTGHGDFADLAGNAVQVQKGGRVSRVEDIASAAINYVKPEALAGADLEKARQLWDEREERFAQQRAAYNEERFQQAQREGKGFSVSRGPAYVKEPFDPARAREVMVNESEKKAWDEAEAERAARINERLQSRYERAQAAGQSPAMPNWYQPVPYQAPEAQPRAGTAARDLIEQFDRTRESATGQAVTAVQSEKAVQTWIEIQNAVSRGPAGAREETLTRQLEIGRPGFTAAIEKLRELRNKAEMAKAKADDYDNGIDRVFNPEESYQARRAARLASEEEGRMADAMRKTIQGDPAMLAKLDELIQVIKSQQENQPTPIAP